MHYHNLCNDDSKVRAGIYAIAAKQEGHYDSLW